MLDDLVKHNHYLVHTTPVEDMFSLLKELYKNKTQTKASIVNNKFKRIERSFSIKWLSAIGAPEYIDYMHHLTKKELRKIYQEMAIHGGYIDRYKSTGDSRSLYDFIFQEISGDIDEMVEVDLDELKFNLNLNKLDQELVDYLKSRVQYYRKVLWDMLNSTSFQMNFYKQLNRLDSWL